jgi:hypothetical protein
MQVIKLDSEIVRAQIEAYTATNSYPDEIRFVQDGNGNWIITEAILGNPKFEGILDLVNQYGILIEYVAADVETTS